MPRIAELEESELDDLGEALTTEGIGNNFEKGCKLFETYLKTVELEQYNEDIANTLVKTVIKNSSILRI
jgi:hypothetical protein